jgi:hypothetical protein
MASLLRILPPDFPVVPLFCGANISDAIRFMYPFSLNVCQREQMVSIQ